jgi:hypothetical protein
MNPVGEQTKMRRACRRIFFDMELNPARERPVG